MNILKLGITSFLAFGGFFLALLTCSKLGYTSSSVIMPVSFLVAFLVSIGALTFLKKIAQPAALKTKIIYVVLGVLLFCVSVYWLFSIVY